MRVSVVIPVYNRRRYLRETVLSLLAERLPLDIVVVDDGSTDRSLETVADLPVRPLRLASNRGISRCRNLGLALCRGEFVTFFDSDDRLVPGGLLRRAEWLAARPRAAAVGGRLGGHIDGDGNPLPGPVPEPPRELTLAAFRQGRGYCCGPWLYLFRRETLRRVGAFDESLGVAADSDLMFRLLAREPVPVLDVPVLWYRRHDANISFRVEAGRSRPQARTLAESYLVNAAHGVQA